MDATQYLKFLVSSTETFPGFRDVDYQPPRYTPRGVGPFGKTKTDTHTQAVMVDGVRFFVTVEKDINQ